MFKALTESQLDAICGGKSTDPLPPAGSLPARAMSAPLSLGQYATPLGTAQTSTKLPPYITVDR
jgi:hypothetical protein